MGSSNRRVFSVSLESMRGTFQMGAAGADAVPSIREAKWKPIPIRVERSVLRQTFTGVPDIYPGVSSVEFNVLAEIGGLPANVAASATYAAPMWADLVRASGFEEVSNGTTKSPRIYTGITGLTGGTAGSPLRHGETVTVAYGTSGGPITGTVVGDFYAEDDLLCVEETSGTAGTGVITITGGTSNRATTGTVVRDVSVIVGFRLRSDTPFTTTGAGMETVSCELYTDGKRVRGQGCMGNVEVLGVHGDALHARFTMTGILNAYADVALPASPNELHNVPPTFLGKDIRVSTIAASPLVYGKDGATIVGGFNRLSVNTGNRVVLRENALDPNGVTFAIINGRAPTGSFNPDEVLNTQFDFVDQFKGGKPMRFKAFIGTHPPAAGQGDGNTVDIIAPGIVTNAMSDEEREIVQAWGLGFACTGGDYDPSAAGETPGSDNELTFLYR